MCINKPLIWSLFGYNKEYEICLMILYLTKFIIGSYVYYTLIYINYVCVCQHVCTYVRTHIRMYVAMYVQPYR